MDGKRVVWTVIVAVLALMALAGPVVIVRDNLRDAGAASPAVGAPPLVVMERIAFDPSTLAVRAGTEVLFDNRDVAPHTVTAQDGSVDSGVINPGGSFRLVVNAALTYRCEIHPAMTARIVLEG